MQDYCANKTNGRMPYAPTSDSVIVFVGAHGCAPASKFHVRCRGVIHYARTHSEERRNELRPYMCKRADRPLAALDGVSWLWECFSMVGAALDGMLFNTRCSFLVNEV